MMSARRPPRLTEPTVGANEGLEEGARLGAPPPDWDDEDPSAGRMGVARGGAGRTWIMRGAITAMVAVGLVPLLWLAYQLGTGGGTAVEIPVVEADPGPVKVRPDDPGGMEVPYRDQLVLNGEAEDGARRVEKLLPPPEVPLPAALPGGADESVDPLPPVEVPDAPDLTTLEPAAGAPSVASEDAIAALVEKVVTSAADAEAAGAAEPAGTAEAAEAAAAAQMAEVVGTFVLQIASLKSDEAARGEWARLRKAFPDLLTGLSLVVQEAEIENVGRVYRMQIGIFPTRSTAADLCAELKARKQDCFILRR